MKFILYLKLQLHVTCMHGSMQPCHGGIYTVVREELFINPHFSPMTCMVNVNISLTFANNIYIKAGYII